MTITVNIIMGISGSGKTTYIKQIEKELKSKTIVFTTDDIYRNKYGNINSGIPDEIKPKFFEDILKSLKQTIKDSKTHNENDVDIFYDKTHTNRKQRAHLYRELKRAGADHIKIHWIAQLPEVAKKQNSNRTGDAFVPDYVIERQFASLDIPRINVDCDEFIIPTTPLSQDFVDRISKLDFVLPQSYMWEMDLLKDSETKRFLMQNVVAHDTPYHLESVDLHIEMVNKEAYRLNSTNLELRYAAFFHDLGKGQVKGKSYLGNSLGQYKTHDKVGAQLAMMALNQVGTEVLTKYKDVPELILKHMDAHNLGPSLNKKLIKRDLLTDDFIENLKLLNCADNRGRVLIGEVIK